MGLSIAISGAVVLSVMMMVLFSFPGFVDKMFSIGDVATQASVIDKSIAQTDISLETLFATATSPLVNFTLNNDDLEKLWNFEKFNVIVEYESGSGDKLEELSFGGQCQGAAPSIGEWCIEGISGDFLDKGILNEGESAEVWTQVSQNLVSGNARVTVSTDNGEVAMLPAPKRSWFDASPVPPATCEFATYGRTFVDTDTGVSYLCDPSKDKWLSTETIVLWGDESGTCDVGNDPNNDDGCNVDWGNGLGPGGGSNVGMYIPYNMTIFGYGYSNDSQSCGSGSYDLEIWGTGSNTDDDNYSLLVEIAAGLTAEAAASNNVDLDITGDQFTLWGIDNNCGGNLDDWAMIIYGKWRHDQP
jgi:hypothetical protein